MKSEIEPEDWGAFAMPKLSLWNRFLYVHLRNIRELVTVFLLTALLVLVSAIAAFIFQLLLSLEL